MHPLVRGMLLRSLTLHNIRSYTDVTLTFPEGIVLLAGDIGAGKSTVLLAIEFALFGIQRGEASGAALLRHGERDGWVELAFELEKHEIRIVRTLKRASTGISQDSGYIMRDGVRQDGTSTELKAAVLELLGYPSDLLTKGKSLLFRYTVYTPQEEMKRILEENAPERLATLRRLFGIDKYERVQQNAKIVVQSLRERQKLLEGKVAALPAKRTQHAELQRSLATLDAQHVTSAGALAQRRDALAALQQEQQTNDALLVELGSVRQAVSGYETQQRLLEQQLRRGQDEHATLANEIERELPPVIDAPQHAARRKEAEQTITLTETAITDARGRLGDVSTRMRLSGDVITQIESLDSCPTCRQHVPHEHRSRIVGDERAKQDALAQERARFEERVTALTVHLQDARRALELARSAEQQAALAALQHKLLEEKRRRIALLLQQLAASAVAISDVQRHLTEQRSRLAMLEPLEAVQRDLKRRLDASRAEERDAAVRHAGLEQQRSGATSQLQRLAEEIITLEKDDASRAKLIDVRDWLAATLVPVVGSIERHVLGSVQRQLDGLFRQWWELLLEENALSCRIDTEFGVRAQQQGFDVPYEYLSGGERTALALAYRLALHRVVNDIVTTIRTRGLLILDEPTDGFSREQLGRVRDVLRELRCRQVLLVSHEPELEGLCDHVVRVQKSGTTSAVS